MAKGGESLGNEESSNEESSKEEEVIPALNHTPGVRPLAPGVVPPPRQLPHIEEGFTGALMACL